MGICNYSKTKSSLKWVKQSTLPCFFLNQEEKKVNIDKKNLANIHENKCLLSTIKAGHGNLDGVREAYCIFVWGKRKSVKIVKYWKGGLFKKKNGTNGQLLL